MLNMKYLNKVFLLALMLICIRAGARALGGAVRRF